MSYKNKDEQRKYQRKWYLERKEEIRKKIRKRVKKEKEKANKYKFEKGCLFCKEKEPICLVFHHINENGEEKVDAISNLIGSNRLFESKIVQDEVSKCIVVCSNCHKKLHAGIIKHGAIE